MARIAGLLLMCMIAGAGAAVAQDPSTPERTATDAAFVRWMTIAGAGAGLALDTFFFFTVHSEYPPELPGAAAAIITSTSLIQLGATAGAFWGIGELIVRLRPAWWQSTLAGPFYGALTGGLAFGLFMGTAFAIGVPTGAITMNPGAEFWPETVDTWYEAFGRGFLGGATFGALFGAMTGLVAAPVATVIHSSVSD